MLLESEKTLEGRCPRIWRLGALVAGLLVVGAVGTFGGVFGQDERTESTQSIESRPGTVDAEPPAEAPPPVARFDKPFPRQWMRWIYDEEVVRKSRESRDDTPARSPGDLQLSLTLWPGSEVTAGEVIIARLGITNPKEAQPSLSLSGGIDETIHFEVTDAQGRPRGRAYAPPPWGEGFVEVFPPGCTKRYETIVNRWYDFAEPGKYSVEARLVVAGHSQQKEEPVVLSLQKTTVTVLPRDRQQLIERCEQLFLAQRLGGAKQVPADPAAGSDYRPSDYACRQALLHLTDEVVFPYLQLMLVAYPEYPDVVAAISYVDSPRVPALLEQLTLRGSEKVRTQAKESLARLRGAGAEAAQVEPSAVPPGKPAVAEAPVLKVSALVERLCGREGLALVAAPEVADAETEVRVDPKSPVGEVATALKAAGLRAFDSAGGHALVILGPPDDALAEDDSERHAVAYRLVRTLTPAQVEHQSKVGRFMGYVESKYLTKAQIEMAYTLLGYPAGRYPSRPPLDKLAVGLWGLGGASGIRGADGKSLVVHAGGAPPPAELLPEPLSGSVLWWYWPHALCGQLDADLVTVDPVRASLQEIVKLLTPSGVIALDDVAVNAATEPLFVAARSAPIGHVVWALEIATGLQAKAPGEDDRPAWRFVTDRYPRRADRTDMLLRLPGLGCGSSVEAPAAKALLARSDARLAPVIAHNMKTLSAVARQPVEQFLPKPRLYGFSDETTYEKLAEEGAVVLLWAPGMRLAISVVEPDGSGGGSEIDLPAF